MGNFYQKTQLPLTIRVYIVIILLNICNKIVINVTVTIQLLILERVVKDEDIK